MVGNPNASELVEADITELVIGQNHPAFSAVQAGVTFIAKNLVQGIQHHCRPGPRTRRSVSALDQAPSRNLRAASRPSVVMMGGSLKVSQNPLINLARSFRLLVAAGLTTKAFAPN